MLVLLGFIFHFFTSPVCWVHIIPAVDGHVNHHNNNISRRGVSCLTISPFLAATKQLYEWFSPSVRLSVCLSVTPFCEARRASHCHSPQTTFSSNSTCCVLSTQKSAMHVVVYADRLTTQHSIVDIVHWSWSYWQFCYPRWHVECFWAALAAHWISSASHTSVLPQHPRRKIVPYRVGWNHHTSDYYG